MSTPTTCGRKDMLFHVLYGASAGAIARLIEQCALDIADEHPTAGVREALQDMRPCLTDPLHVLQIKFFALFNEDERMRRRVSEASSVGVCGLCPLKAERFYDALADELFPAWIKDERVGHADFVDRLRAAYLCA